MHLLLAAGASSRDLLLLATEAGAQGSTSKFSMPIWGWIVFLAAMVGLLLVDLFVFQREAHVVGAKEAGIWSAIWIGLGLLFTGVIYLLYPDPGEASINYLSGFLIEKSLSVDNLFVFVLIFQYFSVPPEYQHRVLFWGIFGAFVFRGIFIALGTVLLAQFAWIAYVFGAFLIYTAYKLASADEMEVHPENNPVLKAFQRFGRITDEYHGQQLTVKKDGKRWATPLLAVLVVVETTDIIFAVDSIPAILAVTREPFIVFSSNAFALLGLRALYFLLADAVRRFEYLDLGVAGILGLVGVKMVVEEAGLVHIPAWANLVVILSILAASIWFSIREQGWDEIKGHVGGQPGSSLDEQEGAEAAAGDQA
ncbi:MAG: TerC family protein [Nitriliruptorales bacterium]|nr:TerC family protein [Nitriliruptorales bacterium]